MAREEGTKCKSLITTLSPEGAVHGPQQVARECLSNAQLALLGVWVSKSQTSKQRGQDAASPIWQAAQDTRQENACRHAPRTSSLRPHAHIVPTSDMARVCIAPHCAVWERSVEGRSRRALTQPTKGCSPDTLP